MEWWWRHTKIVYFVSVQCRGRWSLDGNVSAHAPYHTLCVLRPLWRHVEHAKRLPRRLQLERERFLKWFFNNKELQTITAMCFQWTVTKTGKYLGRRNVLLTTIGYWHTMMIVFGELFQEETTEIEWLETLRECCPRNGQQLELSCIYLSGNRKDLEIHNKSSIEQIFSTVLWLGMV